MAEPTEKQRALLMYQPLVDLSQMTGDQQTTRKPEQQIQAIKHEQNNKQTNKQKADDDRRSTAERGGQAGRHAAKARRGRRGRRGGKAEWKACRHLGMQAGRDAGTQARRHADMQACSRAGMQACGRTRGRVMAASLVHCPPRTACRSWPISLTPWGCLQPIQVERAHTVKNLGSRNSRASFCLG